jgi:hypothetical protein
MSDQEEQENGVKAITTLLEVLGPLRAETRSNVLDYVFKALGITPPAPTAPQAPTPPASTPPLNPPVHPPHTPGVAMDIRTLTDQKKPKTVNQMIAIMAYYLANHAPQGERRDHIIGDDIRRYFPQANFPLPTGRPSVTLSNAKVAGYLDAISDGQFRLNPVGHNLVTHKLPAPEGGTVATRSARRPNKAKPKAKKKKARK